MVHQDLSGACRCPSACAPRLPVRVPVSPVAPWLGRPFLPPAALRPPALGFL